MFTKFEFLKGGKTTENELKSVDEQSQSVEFDLPGDRPIPALSRLQPPPSVMENEESCNMWHLFNYHDESCVDLTDIYKNDRPISRNCSTPAPGVTATAGVFDHDFSSNHRSSFGAAGSDASWMCVVNMADLHSQESSNGLDNHIKLEKNKPDTNVVIGSQTMQHNIATVTTQSLPVVENVTYVTAVSTKAEMPVETKVLQFTTTLPQQIKNEPTVTHNVITLPPSIMTLSDFKDYRVHIKQPGYNQSTSDASISSTSVNTQLNSRPILVLTSCQPMPVTTTVDKPTKSYPKPAYSYSCLIAMALKNSATGVLPVNEIYTFMTENFPYFLTAPDGWKNSVRHNLSLNKCFRKIDNPNTNGHARKGCLWGLNEARIPKMDEEIVKWRKKDPEGIRRSMYYPDRLEAIEKGIINASINSSSGTSNVGDDVLVDVYTEPTDFNQRFIGSEDVLEELLRGGVTDNITVGDYKQSSSIPFARTNQSFITTSSDAPVIAFNGSQQTDVSKAFTIRAEI